MYELAIVALSVVMIVLEWRAGKAESDAYKILYGSFALFFGLLLMSAGQLIVIYTPLNFIVYLGFFILMICLIIEVLMTLLQAIFSSLFKKYGIGWY
jgi:cellulose synthase/poly-beta-1,6-N-acetylglucosamine synthase-like glycosyltransferase